MIGLADTVSISPLTAILWVFYPIGGLILIELFLRSLDNDDDDDGGGGVMTPVYQGI
tara:strand:- start:172 stop:342 length:171 start_codon:yes stop_codon:yes gene_type:complete